MTEFFRVTARSGRSWLWVGCEELRTAAGVLVGDTGPSTFWELEHRVVNGDTGELLAPPVFLPLNHGTKRGDLLWTGGRPPLASDRFVAALREAGCTGFETYDVEVRYRRGTPVPGYQGFVVTGRTGRWQELYVPRTVEVSRHGAEVVGADPSLGGWDGSDVFIETFPDDVLPSWHAFWMTARAVEALRSAGLTGLGLEPAEAHRHLLGLWPPEVLEESVRTRMLVGVRRALGELVERGGPQSTGTWRARNASSSATTSSKASPR